MADSLIGMIPAQRQVQSLTPQMRQALEFLQAPIADLATIIQQEADVNPVLELEFSEETSLDGLREQFDATQGISTESSEAEDASGDSSSGDSTLVDKAPISGDASSSPDDPKEMPEWGDFSALSELDDVDYLYSDGYNNEYNPDAEERRQFLLDSIPSRESLQQHLLSQIGECNFSPNERMLAERIITSLDKDGFLREPLEDIAHSALVDTQTAQVVLSTLQRLDPIGVAARDLRECLLVQLKVNPQTRDSLATKILSQPDAFEPLAYRRFTRLEKRFGVSTKELQGVLDLLQTLEPRPARNFYTEPPVIIHPEIEVRKVDGKWIVVMDDSGLPQIRISRLWRHKCEELRASIGRSRSPQLAAARAQRDYLEERISAGEQLIRNVRGRQNTLRRVAECIVEKQQEYFEKGRSALKPLIMNDVASILGVHETTVSRAVGGKYLRSPQGVVELRSFFTNGVSSTEGTAISSDKVRDRIRQLIENEDPTAPLTDSAIVALLAKDGIKLARRTVVKYRDSMGFLSSALRRSL